MWPSFFDIPVYRLSEAQYYLERESHIKGVLYETENQRRCYERCPDQEKMMRDHLTKCYGGAWDFNEVIGFIRLHFMGMQIRGEWWRVSAKRVTRTRTKQFEWRHWKVVYEEEIPARSTNNEIFELILRYLARAQKDKDLKRFHIDTSVFSRIGPYVDWNTLLKQSSKRPDSSASEAACE